MERPPAGSGFCCALGLALREQWRGLALAQSDVRIGSQLGICLLLIEWSDCVLVDEVERPKLAAFVEYVQKIEQVLDSVQNGIECIGSKTRIS
jgi:hypothetical protein